MDEPDPVAVDGPEEHDEPASSSRASRFDRSPEPNRRDARVLEHEQERDFALLDEFFPVGLAEPGGDVPVDVAHIVAELVLHHLVEFHSAAADGRAILAAEDVFHRVAHPPFQLAQDRQLEVAGETGAGRHGARAGTGGAGRTSPSAGTGVVFRTWLMTRSAVRSSASAS